MDFTPPTRDSLRVDLGDVVGRLEPLQQHVVALVYFHGRTTSEAARLLAVERIVVVTALALAFRHIARWVMDDHPVDSMQFPASVFTPAPDDVELSA